MKKSEALSDGMKFALIAIFGLSVIALLYTFSDGISGNDFWWHVKVGEWIVNNKEVPTHDIFSWYGIEHNIPWVAHEWLSDVIFYLIYASMGTLGIFSLSIICALVMLFLLWKQAGINIKKNILISGMFFGLFAVASSTFFYGRPHLFSFFLLFFELKILYKFWENSDYKGIFAIPLLTMIWSNIHGGSSNLSYILCILFVVVSLFKFNIGCIENKTVEKMTIIKLSIVAILSVGAILVNPIGIDVLLYPYKNLSDNISMTIISEWHAPDAKNMGHLILFYFPIILVLIGFFAERKKIRIIDAAVFGVFTMLFFRSVRFIMLWYIAAVFCGFNYLPECKVKPIGKRTENILIAVCLVAFVFSIGFFAVDTKKTIDDNTLISTVISDNVIDEIKADQPKRIFNDYNFGEALIFNDIPVFFDARADLYSYENILADGVSLMLMEQANPESKIKYVDVEALVEKYNFDSILIPKNRPLYAYLVSHPERYSCAFENTNVGYFKVLDS